MTEEFDIPIPIRLNPFKHHRNYILRILRNASPEFIYNLLDPICNNYIDLYTGTKSPNDIGHAVIHLLKSNYAFHSEDFKHWVDSKNGYRSVQLEDQSEWVVRKSNEVERYVHLHPARTCPFSMRFKGSSLKTAYQLKVNFTDSAEPISLEKVNRVRKQIGLSPVKKLDRNKGILYCYEKFFSQD